MRDLVALLSRRELKVAGLMTGTSMDGLDMALCTIGLPAGGDIRLEAARSVPLPAAMARELVRAPALDLPTLARQDMDLGCFFAGALQDFAAAEGFAPDLVGSHGQTVYHEHRRTTVQIGDPNALATRLGVPVVSDFRRADMVLGGSGAPLVPVFDEMTLRAPDHGVIALNIGGIANITALPPAGANDPVIAFDTGPGNMVLDGIARRFTQGAQDCDRDGAFAARGKVDPQLLSRLLDNPYFASPPPRSTGREQFGDAFVDALVESCRPEEAEEWYALFATAAELTARSIAEACRDHVPASFGIGRMIVSGGGVHNSHLMARLAQLMQPVEVTSSAALGMDPDFKEAMAFALLAVLWLEGRAGNVPSVTGASGPARLGNLTLPLRTPA